MRAKYGAVMGRSGRVIRQMRELGPAWSLGILSSKELPLLKPLLWLSISHITAHAHSSTLQLHITIYPAEHCHKTSFWSTLYSDIPVQHYALVQVYLGAVFVLHNPKPWTEGSDVSFPKRELLNRTSMPPRAALTSSFSVSDANNEVVCPLTNQDGSNCRKRCLGVSVCPLAPHWTPRSKG